MAASFVVKYGSHLLSWDIARTKCKAASYCFPSHKSTKTSVVRQTNDLKVRTQPLRDSDCSYFDRITWAIKWLSQLLTITITARFLLCSQFIIMSVDRRLVLTLVFTLCNLFEHENEAKCCWNDSREARRVCYQLSEAVLRNKLLKNTFLMCLCR